MIGSISENLEIKKFVAKANEAVSSSYSVAVLTSKTSFPTRVNASFSSSFDAIFNAFVFITERAQN